MKFIQINTWRGYLYHNLIKFLRKEDADIVNLQEVNAGLRSESEHFSLYEKLEKELGYRYSFYSPNAKGELGGYKISEGHLILSKHPITHKRILYISGRLRRPGLFTPKDTNVCLLQHALIKANGETLNDLNYKGYFVWASKQGNKVTESHSQRIAKYMNSLDQNEKIILSGDFNLAPESRSLRIISKNYSNLVLRYRIKTTRNETSFFKTPVDNIFVNDKVTVSSLRVPMSYVSDHLPMIMNFR